MPGLRFNLDPSRYTSCMRWKLMIILLVTMGGAAGCQKSLFPKDAPRTQFETYDRVRSRYVPLEEPDAFGNPQPALRARLSQPQ